MTNQHKGLLLLGLFVAWGGVTFYQLTDSGSVDSPSAKPQDESPLPPLNDLALDQNFPNARQNAKFSQPRNIFALQGQQKPQPKQNTPIPSSSKTTQTTPPPPPPGPSPAELAAQRAREQLNQYRFLGYLTRGGESQAFLTNGQAIYIVKQGEMLEGRVQVHKIEPETVVLSTQIRETGNHIQATIPLTSETRS